MTPRSRSSLRRLLDALPLPSRDDALSLDRLRWALGDALPAAQRAAMPTLAPLAAVGRPVVEAQITESAVPVAVAAPAAVPPVAVIEAEEVKP